MARPDVGPLTAGRVTVDDDGVVWTTDVGGNWSAEAHEYTDTELAAATFDGSAIVSGTVADARIASTIARDSEVTSAVSAHAAATDPHGDRSYTDTAAALLVPKTTTVAGHALSANVTVSKSDVGLGSVDNTADASKPVSTAQAAADAAVQAAAIQRSNHTGTQLMATISDAGGAATKNVGTTAGTVAAGDDSRLSDTRTPTDNSVTSAKIVDGTIVNADISASAAIALSKIAAIAQSDVTGLVTALAAKAPTASPTLTGTVTVPNGSGATDAVAMGQRAYVVSQLASGPSTALTASFATIFTSVPTLTLASGETAISQGVIRLVQNAGGTRTLNLQLVIGSTVFGFFTVANFPNAATSYYLPIVITVTADGASSYAASVICSNGSLPTAVSSIFVGGGVGTDNNAGGVAFDIQAKTASTGGTQTMQLQPFTLVRFRP